MAGRRRSNSYRGTSYVPLLMIGGTTLIMLAMVSLGVAWYAGWLGRPTPKVDHTGQVACPALARPIAAFEAITRDDLLDPKTKQLNVIWVPEKTSEGILRDLGKILGRVVKRDKVVGMAFTENDFLPPGTRPGVTAGIPPGKLAISIATEHIPGLEQLRNGDRFDLMISLEDKPNGESISNTEPAALFGGIKPPSLRTSQLSRQHGIKRLVTDAVMVAIAQGNKQSTSGANGLVVPAGTSKTKTAVAKYAEIAVSDEEVGPLTEAIGLGTKLVCVTRSGQPSSERAEAFSTDGLVPVITTSRDVAAFSALSDENLIDDATGQLHLYYFPPDQASPTWITDPTQLYGRVLARPLRRGAFITESDLLPIGSLPGVSAGLPPGMVAMALDPELVQGMDKLQLGDHFAILTRLPTGTATPVGELTWASIYGGQLSPEAARQEQMLRTGIREVVHDAICMGQQPHSISDSTKPSQRPASIVGQPVTIAVPEEDVVRVAQLLRDKAEIFVVTKPAASSHSDPKPANTRPTNSKPYSQPNIKPTNTEVNPQPAAQRDHAHGLPGYTQRLVNQPGKALEHDASELRKFTQVGNDEELIAYPVLVKPVKAFERLSPEDFADPATGKLRLMYFPRDQIDVKWVDNIRQLIDRVVLRDLDVGRTVSQQDLAPAGTLPGPAAGVPFGMLGLTVNSLQIHGLETIAPGASFDLITARALPVNQLADRARRSLASNDAVREATKLPRGRIADSRVLAEQAVLVARLGEVQVVIEKKVGQTQTQKQTVTRVNGEGSVITETVIDDPATQKTMQATTQFVIAVPAELAGSIAGMLDPLQPLQAILRQPTLSGNQSENSAPHSNRVVKRPEQIDAVVIEHVRGTEISSEVFLTDQPSRASDASSEESLNSNRSEVP